MSYTNYLSPKVHRDVVGELVTSWQTTGGTALTGTDSLEIDIPDIPANEYSVFYANNGAVTVTVNVYCQQLVDEVNTDFLLATYTIATATAKVFNLNNIFAGDVGVKFTVTPASAMTNLDTGYLLVKEVG